MEKIIGLADLHVGISLWHDKDVLDGCYEVGDYIKKNKIGAVIIAGDVYDRSRPTPKMNKTFGECLSAINAPKIYIISGNHDITSQYSTVEAFQSPIFSAPGQLYFINEPRQYIIGDLSVLFYPFVPSKDFGAEVSEYINKQTRSEIDMIVTHTDIPGAVFGSEREIQLGEVGSLTGIEKKGIKKILAGHIHKHQHGRFSGIPFVYPGSLARISHAEEKEDKGFIVLDTDTMEWEFIKRKSTRKWATVNIDWKGALPVIKTKADVLKLNVKADIKHRGSFDRSGIEKKLLQKYSQVRLNIEYDRKVSAKAKKAAKGISFEEYEDKWIELNAKGHKADVTKRIKKVLSLIESSQKSNKTFAGLTLKEIKLENFQTIGSAHRKFGRNDCTGILGMFNGVLTKSNGTGKSSFVEAIPWVLYNSTRYSKNGSAVMDTEDKASGSLFLETSKGDVVKVERSQRSNGTASECIITDSKDKILAKGKEVAQWIENSGGLSSKAFDSIIFVGGNNKHGIIGVKPMDRLRALQEPLPLERYTKHALEKIKVLRSENKANLEQYRGVIQEYESLLEEDIDIEDKKKEKIELENNVKMTQIDLDKLKLKIDKLEKDSKKAWELDKLNKEYNYLIDSIEDTEKEFDKMNKKKMPEKSKVVKDCEIVAKEINSITEKRNQIQSTGEVQKNIIASVESELFDLKKAENKNTDKCPTCGQSWNEETKEVHRSKLTSRLQSAQDTRQKIAGQYVMLSKTIKNLEEAEREYLDQLNIVNEYLDEVKEFENDLKIMAKDKKELELQKSKLRITKTCKEIEKEKGELSHTWNKKTSQIGDWKEELSEISNEISIYTQNMARLKLAQTKVKKAEKENSVLNICYDAFSAKGIPQFIIMNIIDEINFVIPNVINDFSFWQDIDITIEPDVSKTNSTLAIWAKIGDKNKREYEGLSQGEREIVNFVFTMAYREVLTSLIDINYSFILIDEALDALDEDNLKAAIKYFKKAKLQSFCISHSDLKDVFTKTVMVNNVDGIAEVV